MTATPRLGLTVPALAREVALDLADGEHVNLGIGIPQLVADHLPNDREIVVHSENGVLGVNGPAPEDAVDWDLIDAGKRPVVVRPGASFFGHPESFTIVRGGHLDVCVLGAYQVSAAGDVANWWDGSGIPAVGGAMDLAIATPRVVVVMTHHTREGQPKILPECTLPVTAVGVVTRIYTELGIFEPQGEHLEARALAVDVDLVRQRTGVPIVVPARTPTLPRVS